MLRRLALTALLALWPALGQAQFATIGPTPATSDNGDRLATTAWVNNLLAAGISGNLVVNGTLSIGNGELHTNIVAPSTPAAGKTWVYVDSTTKALTFKNDAGTIGNAVVPSTAVANQFMTGISAAGVITRAQPAFSDISGQNTCAQEPALTGGVTSSAGSCATTVITNANLTGPVTSVGNATTIGANQVSRANEAQGIARSVIGVTGNATANVADIQGTANQALVVNSGGTALAFGSVNLAAAAAVTGTLPVANGGTGVTGAPSIVVQTFTATGTYTPTAGMQFATIECLGPGGGGGGAAGTAGGIFIAGGGSPGSFSRKRITAADIVTNAAITLPAGGAGGTAGANAGSNGAGDTTVVSNAVNLCVAKAGLGGGAASNALVGQGGAAAPTGTGDLTANGNPGGPGYFNSANTTAILPAGQGGSGPFGGGAVATFCAGGVATAGAAAGNYGSGGAGACASNTASTAAGGAGSKGVVIITEFVNM